MDKRWSLVFLLIASAAACQAQSSGRKIITLEDSVDRAKGLGTSPTMIGLPDARTGSRDRPTSQGMTLEDSANRVKTLGTSPTLTDVPDSRTGAQDRASGQVAVKNVAVSWAEQKEMNSGKTVAQSDVLQVSFDASFKATQARCRQPVFQVTGQVQHADTTRSKLSGGAVSPYSASLPSDVVDARTIPPSSRVTMKIPVKAGDKILYLAIQTTEGLVPLWERGRENRD